VSLGGMLAGTAAGTAETVQGSSKWKSSVFKATALTSEANDPARSTKKSSFLALVEAASHEMNASRKIADDIMQRDLARLVTEEESKGAPNLTRRPTMHRMKSHASSMLEGRDEPAMGQLDGRQIMHFKQVRVLLPHHLAMRIWTSLVVFVELYEAISLPYSVAFSDGQYIAALLTVDAIFIIDLVVNFFTAYREKATNKLVLNRKAVMLNYLKTYFVADLIALLPLWLLPELHPYIELIKLLRLRCLSHMFREHQITSKFSHIYEIATQLVLFVVLLHLCCCFYQLIGGVTDVDPLLVTPDINGYARRLYLTFALFLGDAGIVLKPTTPPYEMLFALLLMLIGAVLCAVLFGSVALQLAHASLSRIRFNERMRVVNESMHFYRLPRQLQDRTRERYEYAWKQYRGGQEFDELLYALSPTLKTDVCVYLYQDMLRNVALFSNCEADVIAALAETLRPQFFLEGDVLCREGQAGREMYFLKCGVVTMSQKQRGILGHLDAGQYFGEMCLLSSKVFGARAFSMDKRTCTISAHTLVDVMVLDNYSLEAIVSDHPVLLTEMLQVATTRLQELGEVARINTFKKAAGVAMLTALNTKRWLRRASNNSLGPAAADSPGKDNAESARPSCIRSSTSDKVSSGKASVAFAVGDPSGAAVSSRDGASVRGGAEVSAGHQMNQVLSVLASLQAEMAALRREVGEIRAERAVNTNQ